MQTITGKFMHHSIYAFLHNGAQGMQDTFALGAAVSWLRGTKENDTLDSLSLAMLVILMFAAIPLTLTVLKFVYGDDGINGHDHHHHNHYNQLEHGQSRNDHNHGTCHTIAKFLHEAFEFTVVGVPFGLLGAGASNNFLSKIWHSKAGCYSVSAVLGFVLAWSNYKLHAGHVHARDSYRQLIKSLPNAKRCKAIAVSVGVFFGHPFQGFLDGRLFLSSINITNRYAQISVPSILALLVTIFEGHTEARSTVLLMSEEKSEEIINQRWHTKLATLIPAMVHGSLAPIGFIEFLRFVFEQSTQKDLAQFVPLYARIGILVLAAIALGYTNTIGFFNTTVCATGEALDNLPSCRFWTNNTSDLDSDIDSDIDNGSLYSQVCNDYKRFNDGSKSSHYGSVSFA